MRQCTAHGTIILPLWKLAKYWSILSPTGEEFISEVKGCIDLPTNKECYALGKGNKSVFGNIDLRLRVLALKTDFGTNKY
jgi:hypothetical protein